MEWNWINITAYSIIGLLLISFLVIARKDIALLFRSPGKHMGTGLSRIWSVARVTIFEARSARVWLLPLIWLVASIVLISVVRPFDESERIPLYVKVLLLGQEILLLVMIGVMACLSMPRERERKIVVTNASKPISRLEMFLGKIVGFSAVAFVLLFVMGLLSWGILLISDRNIRVRADDQYKVALSDYKLAAERRQQAEIKGTTPKAGEIVDVPLPSESLKRLASEGSLFAYNYITVPRRTGFSVAGFIDFTKKPPTRYIKGGSQQKIIYRFAPRIAAPAQSINAPQGQRPFFFFRFGVHSDLISDPPPRQIAIQVTARLLHNPLREQQKTLVLNNNFVAQWEPERPQELFSSEFGDLGPLEIAVTCPTSGVYLHVMECLDPNVDPSNILAISGPNDPNALVFAPEPRPRILGFERRDKQQINGPDPNENFGNGLVPLELAVYRFKAESLAKVPVDGSGKFVVAMNLDVDKTGNNELDTQAIVIAYNENSPTVMTKERARVIEKRITEVRLPGTLLPAKGSTTGDLFIIVECATPKHWIGLTENSVRIELPASPFILNLLKSELVIFCEAVLLIVICVTCSIRLGWPVAMLTASVCVILGYCWQFIDELQKTGGLAALGFNTPGDPGTGYRITDGTLNLFYKLLSILVSLMPDFTRFDSMAYIVELRDMPWYVLGFNIALVFFFSMPFIAAGYMLIRKQELG